MNAFRYGGDDVWAAFAATVIRIETETTTVELRPGGRPVKLPWDGFAHVLTAWNPGRTATPEQNVAANLELRAELDSSGQRFHPAVGVARDGGWVEAGFAVLGMDRGTAVAIARRYGQLAIYEIDRAGVVAIVSCETAG